MARNYKAEAKYEDTPIQVKHREMRNAAARVQAKRGLDKKGDKKDVGHILALGRGGTNKVSNFQEQTIASNRSFARKPTGKMASETSKREAAKRR